MGLEVGLLSEMLIADHACRDVVTKLINLFSNVTYKIVV